MHCICTLKKKNQHKGSNTYTSILQGRFAPSTLSLKRRTSTWAFTYFQIKSSQCWPLVNILSKYLMQATARIFKRDVFRQHADVRVLRARQNGQLSKLCFLWGSSSRVSYLMSGSLFTSINIHASLAFQFIYLFKPLWTLRCRNL